MADSTAQIKTRFLLEGVGKALVELKGFTQGVRAAAVAAEVQTQRTTGGFDRIGRAALKNAAVSITSFKVLGREIQITGRTAVVAGVAISASTKTINVAIAAVAASFRALRASVARTYAFMAAGAVAAATAVRAAFLSIAGRLNLSIGPSSVTGLLSSVSSLATRAATTFTDTFSGIVGGITGTVGKVLSVIRASIVPVAVVAIVGAIGAAVAAAAVSVVPILGALGAVLGNVKVKSQVDKTAETTGPAGFDIKKSTQLQSYFEQIGEKAEDATSIMQKFGDASREIAQNGADSDLAKSLAAAGIAFQDLNGRARSGAAIFQDLTDAFRNGTVDPSQYEAVAEAMAKIVGTGKDSSAFYRLLNQISGDAGGQRLAELSAQAEKFGTVIGPAQIASMQAFETGLGMLKQAYQGLTIALSTSIGPSLGAFFNGFATLIANNRDSIVTYARQAVDTALVLIIETGVVLTQGKRQFEGYQFRFPWLITLRNGAIATWEALKTTWEGIKTFASFVSGAATLGMAVFNKAMGQLGLTVGDVGSGIGTAITWIRNLVGSLAELYVYGSTRPGFEWLFTVERAFKVAGDTARFLWEEVKKVYGAISQAAPDDLGSRLKRSFSEAVDYAIALAKAIYSVANSGTAGSGFEWLDDLVTGFEKAREYASTAAAAVSTFFKALSGDQAALDVSPIAEKIRTQVLAYFPILQALGENVYGFLSGVLPPILSIVNSSLTVLQPYIAKMVAYLESGSGYVVKIVENIAKFFSGTKTQNLDEGFKWVGSTIEMLKSFGTVVIETVQLIGDLGRVITQHLSEPLTKLDKSDERFAWVLKVIDYLGAFKTAVMAISGVVGGLASALTGGFLGPVQSVVGLFFVVKFAGWIKSALLSVGRLKTELASLAMTAPGTLARGAGGAIPILGAVLAGGAAGNALGPVGGLVGMIVGGVTAAFGSSGLRASIKAAFPTVAEQAAVLVAAEKAAAVAKAGGVVGAAAPAARAGASAFGAVASAGGAVTNTVVAGEIVAAEVAGSGLRAGLAFAGGALLRFAGVIGAIYTAYEVADLVADLTGLKARIKKMMTVDNSPEARLDRAKNNGGSYAESFDPKSGTPIDTETKAELRYGTANTRVGDFLNPYTQNEDLVRAGVSDRNADGTAKSPYQIQLDYNEAMGLGRKITQPQLNARNDSSDGLMQQFTRYGVDDVKTMTMPDDEAQAAIERRNFLRSGGATSAPPVLDAAALENAVTRGTKAGLDGISKTPVIIGGRGAVDNIERQNRDGGFAQPQLVPGY